MCVTTCRRIERRRGTRRPVDSREPSRPFRRACTSDRRAPQNAGKAARSPSVRSLQNDIISLYNRTFSYWWDTRYGRDQIGTGRRQEAPLLQRRRRRLAQSPRRPLHRARRLLQPDCGRRRGRRAALARSHQLLAAARRADVRHGRGAGQADGEARASRRSRLSTVKRHAAGRRRERPGARAAPPLTAPTLGIPGQARSDMVVMGEIAAAYGVRGWVKVKSYTVEPQALLGYPTWWVQRRQGTTWQPMALREGREHSGTLIAELSGVASREDAMQLRGARVGVPREQLPPAADGEIYHAELVGLDVINRAGVRLGRVAAVQEFGAHPILRVERDDGGAHCLIPFVPAYVDGVDVAAKRVDVDWEADY